MSSKCMICGLAFTKVLVKGTPLKKLSEKEMCDYFEEERDFDSKIRNGQEISTEYVFLFKIGNIWSCPVHLPH